MKLTSKTRLLLSCSVLLCSLCLMGCTASTRKDSHRAWTDLKVSTQSAAKATGGMLVSLRELLHLGVKSAVGWTTEVMDDPAARYQQLSRQQSLANLPDPQWHYRRVSSGIDSQP